MMKILIVTSNYPRWAGDSTTPFVHNFAKELIAQGCQVRVIAPHFLGSALEENLDGVTVFRFRYWLPIKAQTVCYQGGALGNLKKSPIEKLKLPLLVFSEFIAVLRHVLTWKPDIVNSHWLIPQGFVSSLACILTKTKHVATVHGGDVFALNSGVLKKFKRFAINNASITTVNSSATESKVKALSPNSGTRLLRLPTGVIPLPLVSDEESNVLRQSLLKDKSEKLILFVGRLSEEKGVGDLIEAIKLLRDMQHNLRLIIVGEGHDKTKFEDKVLENDLAEYVNFIGWVSSQDVYHYFSACDLFVGPSKEGGDGWIEAQGLTFVEAMLAGCPVIGSNSGGIPDAVKDKITGRLVNPGDPKDIAKQIANCLSDHSATILMKENARDFAKAQYLVSNTVKKFLDAVKKL